MRLLVLAESPYFGGITSHLLALLEGFRAHPQGIELVLATLPGRGTDTTLLDVARARGHEIRLLPMACPYDARVLLRLRRLVREERVTLVHTHNYRATLIAALALPGIPLLNTCHGPIVDPTCRLRLWQRAELVAMRRSRAVVAVAEHVRAWLLARGLPENRVHTIHNGYAPADNADGPSRADLGIPEGATLYLYAGRLAPGKGLETFLDALAGMADTTALIVGDGPLREALTAQAQASGIHATFTGAVADIAPYYRMSDVVVLPSSMEALPMSLIEAAAHAKPAVANEVGGVPEVVLDGETGLLVPAGDVVSLREALARLRDPALRTSLGRAARARWQDHFTIERMVSQLAALYRAAAG